jgi:molybdopterin-guanine dinucleotide biosynthesis protein A
MLDVEGFILVGGASRRMGRDKSLLVINGEPIVQRIAGELGNVANRIRIVGPPSDHFESVPDTYPHWGPLGGIHAALGAASSEYCLIVACDLPFVTCELFERLLGKLEETTDAIVPVQEDGRPQPLCALYRKRCLSTAAQAIADGEHMPRAFLDRIATHFVDFGKLSSLPGAEYFFLNINTPANYQRAQEIATSLMGRTR